MTIFVKEFLQTNDANTINKQTTDYENKRGEFEKEVDALTEKIEQFEKDHPDTLKNE